MVVAAVAASSGRASHSPRRGGAVGMICLLLVFWLPACLFVCAFACVFGMDSL